MRQIVSQPSAQNTAQCAAQNTAQAKANYGFLLARAASLVLCLGIALGSTGSLPAVAEPSQNAGFDPSLVPSAPWSSLLGSCVRAIDNQAGTAVDYDCFAAQEGQLDDYLQALSAVEQGTLLAQPKAAQLAFLINAYNAWTVKLILNNWPGVVSIRDLGSILRSPWKLNFIPLLGDTVSLDDIEHGMIRESGRFDDPRIHFAVNCASIGCPALRREAYTAQDIETQLEDQTRSFLADASRNRMAGDRLEVSSIFKWYRDDFEKGWENIHALRDFLYRYRDALKLTPAQAERLANGTLTVEFLDYDWRLNKTR